MMWMIHPIRSKCWPNIRCRLFQPNRFWGQRVEGHNLHRWGLCVTHHLLSPPRYQLFFLMRTMTTQLEWPRRMKARWMFRTRFMSSFLCWPLDSLGPLSKELGGLLVWLSTHWRKHDAKFFPYLHIRSFYTIPVVDDTILNWVLKCQHTSLGLSLVTNIGFFAVHTDHNSLVLGSSDNCWETASWSIISGNTGFALSWSIINDDCWVFLAHLFADK